MSISNPNLVGVSITGNTSGATSLVNYGTLTLAGGANITLSQAGNAVTISGGAGGGGGVDFLMSGNTSGTSSVITSGTLYLQAISPVGLSQSTTVGTASTTSNVISVFGPTYAAAGGLGLSTTGGTISYSQTAQSSQTVVSGFQISGNTSGTSSLISNGTLYLQAVSPLLLSQSTTVGANSSTSNVITISGPTYSAGGLLSLSTTNGIISYNVTTPSVTNFSTVSLTASGANTFSSSTGTMNNVLAFSGMGIASVGMSANSISISVPAQSAPANVVNSIGPSGSLSSGQITISGVNITVSSNGAGVIQLSAGAGGAAGTNTISASGTSIAGSALSLALAAGANVSLQTATAAGSMTVSVSGLNALSVLGGSSTGTMTLSAGPNITISSSGASVIGISGPAGIAAKVSLYQNASFDLVNSAVITGSWTATTSNTAFGSTLFLQRAFIPSAINMTEVDLAQQLSFASSSVSGAGTMSQSFAVYSFANSTSLASVFSASSSWVWVSGSSSANLTGVQNGWTGLLIHSMGLSSGTGGVSSLTAGEYVIGNIVNVSAAAAASNGGSNMSMSLYGVGAITNITAGSSSVLDSAGLAAVSAMTGSTSTTVTVFTAGPPGFGISGVVSTGGASTTAVSTFTAGAQVLEAVVTSATSHFTLAIAASTSGANFYKTGGLSAGSFFGTANTFIGLTAAGTVGNPAFSYQNTGSSFTSASPSYFSCGVMATAGIPVAITLTSTNVTMTGTLALLQPWFALIGS